MKNILFFITLFLSVNASAQFVDDFTDGDFTQNPAWSGNVEKFIVNASNQLQLNAPAITSTAWLSTPSQSINNASWQCYFKANLLLTSGNYADFYLVSNNADLSGALNGYYIMIGNTNKEIALWKQSGTTKTKLAAGASQRLPATGTLTEVTVKATRDDAGNWTIYSKLPGESDFTLECSVFDNTCVSSAFSGIFCNYSSTNSAKYFFDDFIVTGDPYIDTTTPSTFGDIIFNEIMANPSPPVGLPEIEYVELYNRRPYPLNLQGWNFYYNARAYAITNGQIDANGYLLLCAPGSKEQLSGFGAVATLSSFPALSNSGQLIYLTNEKDSLIAFVQYDSKWFRDSFKSSGGWSLECIDSDNLSGTAGNWVDSNDPSGGTPGRENSVSGTIADESLPKIIAVSFTLPTTLTLQFNRSMSPTDLAVLSHYQVSDGMTVTSLQRDFPLGQWVQLTLSAVPEREKIYSLTVSNLYDVNGHPLTQTVSFGVPDTCLYNDLIINEILSHPYTGGAVFVELYNRSEKIIDLKNLWLNRVKSTGGLDTGFPITPLGEQLLPGDYVVLTPSLKDVCNFYSCKEDVNYVEMSSFPSLPNAAGNVMLIQRNGAVIDSASYSEKQHDPMIKNPQGVSFERVNPDFPSSDPANWHSCSSDAGYATPGYQNSQYRNLSDNTPEEKFFWLDNKSFTPDNDGSADLLLIRYAMPDNGYSATVTVYDIAGRRIKQLTNNALLGTTGVLTWNGISDAGKIAQVGVYIIYIDAIQPMTGKRTQAKLVCVLGAK